MSVVHSSLVYRVVILLQVKHHLELQSNGFINVDGPQKVAAYVNSDRLFGIEETFAEDTTDTFDLLTEVRLLSTFVMSKLET